MGDAANGIANDIPRCPRNHLLQESQNRQKIRFLSIGMEGGVRKPFFPMISLSGLELAVSKSRAFFVSWRPAERPMCDFQREERKEDIWKRYSVS